VLDDYHLGSWLVQPQRDCIVRGDEVVHLKPKVMAVLNCLAESGGEVVTRESLFECVWPAQIVSDATLTQCVSELRHAFGDSAREPSFIETIPKVGFRLIPEVVAASQATEVESPGPGVDGARNSRRATARSLVFAAVGLLAIGAVAVALRQSPTEPTPVAEPPAAATTSLAVLPFADVSPDHGQDWIADSLGEQLISRLSRLEGLEVPGKVAIHTLEDGRPDLAAVAGDLGVDFVVEGSVFRLEHDLRVNTRLVEVATGDIWWSDEWTRPLENFLEIQELITEGVAVALSIRLDVGDIGRDPLGPSDVEAFWSVDRAISAVVADTRESWLEAVREIDNAVERDPTYMKAWLWASFIYTMAARKIDDIAHRDWSALSENALDRALQLAPGQPGVLTMLISHFKHWNQFDALERAISQAGPLNSVDDPLLLFQIGVSRIHTGSSNEALDLLERARLLDQSGFAHFKRMLAWARMLNGRTDEALSLYDAAWDQDDVLRADCSNEAVLVALADGDQGAVGKWLIRARESTELGYSSLHRAMAEHLEHPPAARAELHALFEQSREHLEDGFIAVWAAYFGDNELALEATLRTPNSWWIWHPLMAPVRNRPAFKDMLVELGLVDYWKTYGWGDYCRPEESGSFVCR